MIASFALLVSPILLPSCVPESGAALARVQEAGLRVGFAVEPPYAFIDSVGRATGEAPEVLRTVAEALEIEKVRWLPFEFTELIAALQSGRIDVIAAGMYITEARTRAVRFSIPTLCVGPALVRSVDDAEHGGGAGEEGAPEELVRPADAGAPGSLAGIDRVSVLAGSVELTAAASAGVDPARLLVVPDVATGIAALREGKVSGLLISRPTARRFVRRDPSLLLHEMPAGATLLPEAEGCAGFAFRPEDGGLAEAFDRELAGYLGSERHLAMIRSFGFDDQDLAPAEADSR